MNSEWLLEVIRLSFQSVWGQILLFVPNVLGALIILIIGCIIALGVEKIAERIIHHLKIDKLLSKLGIGDFLRQMDIDLDSGYFVGKFIYWFITLVFVMSASDVLGFEGLSNYLVDVLYFVPDVIISFLILIATVIIANFVKKLAQASVKSLKVKTAKFIGGIAWWGVFVFGLLTSLSQLGVAENIITTVITGFIAMMALAGGLAFGLGGKNEAEKILSRVHDNWE